MTKIERKIKPSTEDDEKDKKSFIGVSKHICYVEKAISEASKMDSSVLIIGPSGTGKDLIAEGIHSNSGRQGKLIAVNCAAISESLFESELFGIEPGVATGVGKRIGKIKEAEGGTLFLDEIGDMPMSLQPKLLRFLNSKSYQPAGGKEQPSDVKIISATNKNVSDPKILREDLYYRLAGYLIRTLPLKDRPEDIICLVNHFANEHKVNKKNILTLKPLFYSYSFPGNVRELENLLKQSDDANYIISEIEKNRPKEPITPPYKAHHNNETITEIGRRTNDHNGNMDDYTKDKKKYDAFYAAIDYAKNGDEDIDFRKIILCYEVLYLYQEGISFDMIAKVLHVTRSDITKDKIEKYFGFPLPDKHNSHRIETWTDAFNMVSHKLLKQETEKTHKDTPLELDEILIEMLCVIAKLEKPFEKTGTNIINELSLSETFKISPQKTAHILSQLKNAQYIHYDRFGNLHGITDSARDFLDKKNKLP